MGGATLADRAKAILLTPNTEWPAIAAEPATPAGLYTGYILPLAAIPPLATFLRGVLFGYGAFGFSYHPSVFSALSLAITHYVLTLVGVYVLALIVANLAPTFGGTKDMVQALKLVAYASTASWLAGIFSLIPGLGILGLLGLYSFYLFYTGLPVVMRSPPAKAMPYTAVVVIVTLVLALVISPLSAALMGNSALPGRFGDLGAGAGAGAGTLSLPGGTTVGLDKLQQAARAMQDATQRAETGDTHAARVPSAALKTFLPDSLPGGLARTETSSAGGQIAGFGGGVAEAKYASGDQTVTLTVSDLGPVGALASLGGALGVSGDEETATSYSRISQEDGRTVAEAYDRGSHTGSYGMVIASRFLVKAEGTGVAMDTLRAVVRNVDLAQLTAMAK
jgi:hypothetical protein